MRPLLPLLSLFLPQLHAAPLHDEPRTLYVAAYSGFIHTLHFTPSVSDPTAALKVVHSLDVGDAKPSWLHLRDGILYATTRTHYPTPQDSSGGVFAFRTSAERGLEEIGSASTNSIGAVALDISPDGSKLIVPNIDASSLTLLPLGPNGHISPATQTFHYTLTVPGPGTNDTQLAPHPHQAVFTPSGRHFVVADRGADRLYAYRTTGPGGGVVQAANYSVPLGMGPRHVLFNERGEGGLVMYLVGELDNSVHVYSVHEDEGEGAGSESVVTTAAAGDDTANSSIRLTFQRRYSTLGADLPPTAPLSNDLAAELGLSHDARFLYVSNRNTQTLADDNIAVFAVSHQQQQQQGTTNAVGRLEFRGKSSTHGKLPRHFSLSGGARNRYVAVANQVGNGVVVMERDGETGLLGRVVGNLSLGEVDATSAKGPVAVIWDE